MIFLEEGFGLTTNLEETINSNKKSYIIPICSVYNYVPPFWLRCDILIFTIQLLLRNNDTFGKILIIDPTFLVPIYPAYMKKIVDTMAKTYKKAKKSIVANNCNISDYDHIVTVENVEGCHWRLLFIANIKEFINNKSFILLFDSRVGFPKKNYKSTTKSKFDSIYFHSWLLFCLLEEKTVPMPNNKKKVIQEFFSSKGSDKMDPHHKFLSHFYPMRKGNKKPIMPLLVVNCFHQRNNYDCGPFCIMYLKEFLKVSILKINL